MIVCHLDTARVILTALSHDIDCSIDSLISIEGDCCRIFQNDDAFHFFGSNAYNVSLDTVDHDQRRVLAVQCLQSAYIESRIHICITTTALQRYQAIALTNNGIADILGTTTVGSFGTNDRHGTGSLLTGQQSLGTYINGLAYKLVGLLFV